MNILTKHLKKHDNLWLFMFSARCLIEGLSRAKMTQQLFEL